MNRLELYFTWAVLALTLYGVGRVNKQIDDLRQELEAFRATMMGEKPPDSDDY